MYWLQYLWQIALPLEDSILSYLSYFGLNKMADILQRTVSNAYPWIKMFAFRIIYHWKCLLRDSVDKKSALLEILDWYRIGNEPSSKPMMALSTIAYVHHEALTHRGKKQNGRNFAHIFQCISLNEKYEFWLIFHWSLFLRIQLTIFQHWFR